MAVHRLVPDWEVPEACVYPGRPLSGLGEITVRAASLLGAGQAQAFAGLRSGSRGNSRGLRVLGVGGLPLLSETALGCSLGPCCKLLLVHCSAFRGRIWKYFPSRKEAGEAGLTVGKTSALMEVVRGVQKRILGPGIFFNARGENRMALKTCPCTAGLLGG